MGGVLSKFRTPLFWLAGFTFFSLADVGVLVAGYLFAFGPTSRVAPSSTVALQMAFLLKTDCGLPLPLLFLAFAIFYLVFGALADPRLVRLQFWVISLGGALILGPMVGLQLFGLPRRAVGAERLFALCSTVTR
jgi:hypothetical protein